MVAFFIVVIGLAIAGVKITKEQYEIDSKRQQMNKNATHNMMVEMTGKSKAEKKAIARKYGIR